MVLGRCSKKLTLYVSAVCFICAAGVQFRKLNQSIENPFTIKSSSFANRIWKYVPFAKFVLNKIILWTIIAWIHLLSLRIALGVGECIHIRNLNAFIIMVKESKKLLLFFAYRITHGLAVTELRCLLFKSTLFIRSNAFKTPWKLLYVNNSSCNFSQNLR